jgi:acyl-CoA thioesterase-2
MSGLIDVLHLQTMGPDDYRGNSGKEGWFSIFGGHVIAQALNAANHTVPSGRLAHSLHAYFIRPGEFDSAIDYHVDRDHDGGSFNSRRVTALQHGKPILTLSASYHIGESGIAHAPAMPSVPPPEDLETLESILKKRADKLPEALRKSVRSPVATIEIRPVDGAPPFDPAPRPAKDAMWFRIPGAAIEDPALKRVLLAYASDLLLMSTVTRPHRAALSMRTIVTSLDHALWFHDEFQSDGWLLYVQTSPWAGNGRGFCEGKIFAADGRHVASVAQEGLIRLRK